MRGNLENGVEAMEKYAGSNQEGWFVREEEERATPSVAAAPCRSWWLVHSGDEAGLAGGCAL